jgi:hypothetical protein
MNKAKPLEILMSLRGDVHFFLRNEATGEVICDEWRRNLIVTVGKNHVADQLADQGEATMSHMAIGTGTTSAVVTDTALETELDRNALTSKTQGSGGNENKVTYVGDWAPGDGTGAITEAAVFNSPSAGTMLSRIVFDVRNKGASDSLTITWILTISA